MKILAIRGRNIASLAGSFDIDFEHGVLGHTGLFAITGPTGAGKTSILDAACLALFDTTPRTRESSKVRPGLGEDDDQRITASDPRSLLRRGAGECHAVVDFIGCDGRRYRARWELRRARGKADGRHQNQEMSLLCLDTGEAEGGTRSETKQAIVRRIGLTFDQFRRSALLAQGDFAAFLAAGADERSELLEKMSGTDLYTRLSVAAYERHKREREALQLLEARRAEVGVLGDEQRARVETALDVATASETSAAYEVQVGRQAVDWHATDVRLTAEVDAGLGAVTAALAGWHASAQTREKLDQVDEVQELREPVGAADRAEAEVVRLNGALPERRARVAAAQVSEGAAAGRVHDAQAGLVGALGEAESLRPEIEAAARLDVEVDAARQAAVRARVESDRQKGALVQSEQRLGVAGQRRDQARGRYEEAKRWLDAHTPHALLAEQWARWEDALGRYTRARQALQRLDAARPGLVDEHETAAASLDQTQAGLQAAEERLGAATTAWKAADEAAAAIDTVALLARDRTLEARAGLITQARGLAQRHLEQAEQRSAARQGREQAEVAAAAALAAAQQRQGELQALAGRLEEAEHVSALAEAARSHDDQRADLRPGEPCPLCGSPAHPWAEAGSPLSARVDDARQAVAALRKEQTALSGAEQAARSEADSWNRSVAAETRRLADIEAALARVGERWAQAGADLSAPLGDPGGPALVALAESVAGERAAVAAQRAEAEAARAHARQLHDDAETARAERDNAGSRVRETERRLALAGNALAEHDTALRNESARRREAETELSSVLCLDPGWGAALAADPDAFGHERAAEVTAWRAQQAARERAQGELSEAEPQVAAAEAAVEAATRGLADAETEASARSRALDDLATRRKGQLGGRATAEVRDSLERRLVEARAALEGAQAIFARAAQESAAAMAAAQEAEAHAEAAGERRQAALAACDAALQAVGLPLEEVRARLVFDRGWQEARRAEISALRDALAQARTRSDERTTRQAAHRMQPPPLDAVAAPIALAEAEAALRAATEQAAEARASLRADDAARARMLTLAADIDAQTAVAGHWAIMNGLIGSADGKKLRVFAQSLTLDALLAHANGHLRELAPRYSLMRVPGHDLDIQVADDDLAGEVRGVNSLSGGESFLVSLALALGLASLSSREARVDTLFVDEGFGTLDSNSLGIALDMLEQLQASGRQVGIISHVQGLAERIGAQVRVDPRGGGTSGVRVIGP